MFSGTKLVLAGIVVVCIIVLLLLCSPRSSSGISEDKFVEVYVRLSTASEMFVVDSTGLEEERERIFKEAGVSQKEMDDFVSRLSEEPQKWAKVWKKIVEKLEQGRQEISPP